MINVHFTIFILDRENHGIKSNIGMEDVIKKPASVSRSDGSNLSEVL